MIPQKGKILKVSASILMCFIPLRRGGFFPACVGYTAQKMKFSVF